MLAREFLNKVSNRMKRNLSKRRVEAEIFTSSFLPQNTNSTQTAATTQKTSGTHVRKSGEVQNKGTPLHKNKRSHGRSKLTKWCKKNKRNQGRTTVVIKGPERARLRRKSGRGRTLLPSGDRVNPRGKVPGPRGATGLTRMIGVAIVKNWLSATAVATKHTRHSPVSLGPLVCTQTGRHKKKPPLPSGSGAGSIREERAWEVIHRPSNAQACHYSTCEGSKHE